MSDKRPLTDDERNYMLQELISVIEAYGGDIPFTLECIKASQTPPEMDEAKKIFIDALTISIKQGYTLTDLKNSLPGAENVPTVTERQ